MTRYRYTGARPYVIIVDGETHRLNPGDYIELPKEKLKTRQLRKLLEEAEA